MSETVEPLLSLHRIPAAVVYDEATFEPADKERFYGGGDYTSPASTPSWMPSTSLR